MFSVLLVKGRNGKDLLMMEGYTYYQHKILRDGFRWSCTQMGSRSCRGFLHVNHDMFVLRAFTEHTHPPPWKAPKHSRTKDVMEFYLRPSGRINLRLNNFTFYKHLKARSNAHRWSCTAYGSKWKCKAHLIITDRLEVLKANIFHSHPPSLKKEMKGPVPKLMKKEGKQDTQNNSNISIDENYPALTPFQNYLAAHSVFGSY
ncbi:hypothetical protein HF086_005605 [Spodoptera exigua]|uniref:FLYWCH-type domain-containing protein n=1 Tax=Spodoptera exigua TaxID=7107 RepID=A0A922MZ94_SPOEX|nr:hypothetical protein HF086_005605 [Spodoptera exigua]